MFSDGRPIFLQIAEMIENDIVAGNLGEESQVPSTNEFAAMYRINPATAAKGINLLVEDGILHKRRGIGMGETTADGEYTLLPVVCLGNCDQAPSIMIGDETFGRMTPEKLDEVLDRLEAERKAGPA